MANRTLHLKHARFRSGRKKGFVPPAIDQLLLQVKTKAPNFAQRHFPPPNALPAGTPCGFINSIKPRNPKHGPGVLFEIFFYTFGTQSDQFKPDFSKASPDIKTGPILDTQGNTREIVYSYRCVALGQSILVEFNPRAGGLDHLSKLLAYVFHTYCQKGLPTIEFLDVSTKEIDKAIKAGGGVDTVMLKMISANKPSSNHGFADTLHNLRKKLTGAKQVTVVWEAEDGVISAKNAIEAAQEYDTDDTAIERMSIKLKDGQVIPALDRYREKRKIVVQTTPSGAVAVTEIEEALWNYLDELRMVQDGGWRVIDDQGNFISAKAISIKAKK